MVEPNTNTNTNINTNPNPNLNYKPKPKQEQPAVSGPVLSAIGRSRHGKGMAELWRE